MLMKIRPPFGPELLEEATAKIVSLLAERDHSRVLELGAGFSTLWFAGFADVELVSLETDYGWWREVTEAAEKEDFIVEPHVWLVKPEEMLPVIKDFPDGHFDLVLVDCLDELRLPALHAAMPKVRPGGWLLLDDTHWPALEGAAEGMAKVGWPAETIKGRHVRHTGIEHFHQTSFFRKPGGAT